METNHQFKPGDCVACRHHGHVATVLSSELFFDEEFVTIEFIDGVDKKITKLPAHRLVHNQLTLF
jgi:hypothetical protein